VTVTDFLNDANKVILVICDFFRQISAKICAKVSASCFLIICLMVLYNT
jgi:hypothetical protein